MSRPADHRIGRVSQYQCREPARAATPGRGATRIGLHARRGPTNAGSRTFLRDLHRRRMATLARRLLVRSGVGERMLKSKLQILNGTTARRTSLALSMLTGRVVEPLSLVADAYHLFNMGEGEPVRPAPPVALHRQRRQYAARTVY